MASPLIVIPARIRSELGIEEGSELVALVEGEAVGRLQGFRFVPETGAVEVDRKALVNAAHRALRTEIA